MAYYVSKVKIATDTPKGVKWQSETYLVDAISVTHAEELVTKDFEGLPCNSSNIYMLRRNA